MRFPVKIISKIISEDPGGEDGLDDGAAVLLGAGDAGTAF